MRSIDYAKAVGAGVLLLALNLALTTVVITVYALLIEPGQPQAHYNAMAPRIGAWSGPIGGTLLLFVAGWIFARRRPDRNGQAFILAVLAAYFVVDVLIALPMGGLKGLLQPAFAFHLVGAFAGGLAGAALGRRRPEVAPG